MTTVRVFAYIGATLLVLATVVCVFFGVGALVAGAGVASSIRSSGELGGEFGDALGGLLGGLAGAFGVLFLVMAVVNGLFTWFWFWAGGALGRGSAVARVLVTVIFGLDVVWGLVVLVAALGTAPRDAVGPALLAALGLIALPGLLITLLWAPESARRHFAPVPPAMPAPWGSVPYAAPAPLGAWPLDASTDRMRPDGGPAPRCRRCGTETERHWVHCGHCGDRLPTVGV